MNISNVLIVSPHPDDAVFSLGGAIINGYLKDITVLNVFTKSRYTVDCPGEVEEITRMRMEEEIKVMKKIGGRFISLDFPDASIRPEYKNEEDYMNPENQPHKDSVWNDVNHRIKKVLSAKQYRWFAFPGAVGDNVDHKIVAEVGKDYLMQGYPVIFYEDGSYEMAIDDSSVINHLNRIGVKLWSYVFKFKNVQDKIDLVSLYTSQINDYIISNIKLLALEREGERIWTAKANCLKLTSIE